MFQALNEHMVQDCQGVAHPGRRGCRSGVLLALMLLLCAGPKANAQNFAPAWYTQPPQPTDRWYGVGGAPRNGNPALALQKAEAIALAQLATRIQVDVEKEFVRRILSVSLNLREELREDVTSQLRLEVKSALPENHLEQQTCPIFSRYCYALVSLERARLEALLRSRTEAMARLRPALEYGLTQLLIPAPGQTRVIAMAPFLSENYRQDFTLEYGLETRLGSHLRARVEEVMSRRSELKVMTLEQRLASAPWSKVGSSQQADALTVSGRYRVEGDRLVLSLRLEDANRSQLLGATDVELPRMSVPLNDAPLPPPPTSSERMMLGPVLEEPERGIVLRVSPTRGMGARYRPAENLVIAVEPDQPCHLRLYSVVADGGGILLFPNHHHPDDIIPAGRERLIGGPEDRFELPIQPPTGIEVLKAICSSKPYSDAEALRAHLAQRSDFELVEAPDATALRSWIRRGIPHDARLGEASSAYHVDE